MVPVISVFTPERSVPVPANAFSISSMNTMTRGGSMPASTASKKSFTFWTPPISSKVSPPRHTDRPGVCSMIWRLRSQRHRQSLLCREGGQADEGIYRPIDHWALGLMQLGCVESLPYDLLQVSG